VARVFADALAHRGPDGEGFLVVRSGGEPALRRARADVRDDERLEGLLVHRRLSIIDLTTGDQPMGTADGRAWIVYNGEIYNYRDLRDELRRSESEPFRTTSDTEVILRVYRRWGIDGLRRLNGIFAFALYDAAAGELILARDPVGVKPVYWCAGPYGVAFASEIRSLRAAGLAASELSPESLAQYLFYRFVPSPGTVWRDVCKVRPGHALRFGPGGRLVADVDFAAPAPAPGRLDLDALADAFRSAARRQLLSDVPVGAYLSGGLDSSLVVAAMCAAGARPWSFGIGFAPTATDPGELAASQAASAILGTDHAGVEVTPEPYYARFARAVLEVEEPLAEAGMLLLSDLAALAARRVKVVLTGQGADEPLGGYPRHQAARLALLARPLLGPLARRAAAGTGAWHRFLGLAAARSGAERAAAAYNPLRPAEAGAVVRGCGAAAGHDAIVAGVAPWWERSRGLDPMARLLYVDVRTSLADDLLLMGDKTAMAHGLEARVPYLDLEYLAALEAIPGATRVPLWRRRKWLQHALGRRILPRPLAASLVGSRNPFRKKRGFEVPVDAWLRYGFVTGLLDVLIGPGSALPAYIDRAFIRRTVEPFLRGAGAYRPVLALYVLETWLRAEVAGVATAELPHATAVGAGA
jgi:asparagine synthase (glutamine-hydrolysing)